MIHSRLLPHLIYASLLARADTQAPSPWYPNYTQPSQAVMMSLMGMTSPMGSMKMTSSMSKNQFLMMSCQMSNETGSRE